MSRFAVFTDAIIVALASLAAYWLRFNLDLFPDRPAPQLELYIRFSLLAGVFGGVAFRGVGLYDGGPNSWRLPVLIRGTFIVTVALFLISFLFREQLFGNNFETLSRIILLLFWPLCVTGLAFWRLLLERLTRAIPGLRRPERILIIGVNEVSRRFVASLAAQDWGSEVVGYVPYAHHSDRTSDVEIVGELTSLRTTLQDLRIDEAVVTDTEQHPEELTRILQDCRASVVKLSLIPGISSLLLGPVAMEERAGFPLLRPTEHLAAAWNQRLKRLLDIMVASGLVLASSPILGLIAIGIRLDSTGPVFFRQVRVGKGGKPFVLYKFRTMVTDAEQGREELASQQSGSDPILRLPSDPRVTRFGRVLRRYSLDELPQLINVLLGSMSLVGPRPHIPEEVAYYSDWHRRKFDVLPGISGLTQVSGRKSLTLDDMIELDLYYIDNWSVWLDLRIMYQTIGVVISGRGAY